MKTFKISIMAILLALICALPQKVAVACPQVWVTSFDASIAVGQIFSFCLDPVTVAGCWGSGCTGPKRFRVFFTPIEDPSICFGSLLNGNDPFDNRVKAMVLDGELNGVCGQVTIPFTVCSIECSEKFNVHIAPICGGIGAYSQTIAVNISCVP